MSAPIDPAAKASQDAARRRDGKYGVQPVPEGDPGGDLMASVGPDSPALSDVPVAAGVRLRRLHESISGAVENLCHQWTVAEERRTGLTVIENDYRNGARGGPDFSVYGDSAWTDPATVGATPMLPWSPPHTGRAVAKIDADGTYRYLDPQTGEMVECRPNEEALKQSVTDIVLDDLDDDDVRLIIDAAASLHDEDSGVPLEMRTYDPASHHILSRLIRRARMYDSKHIHPFVVRAARDRFELDSDSAADPGYRVVFSPDRHDRLGEITGRTYDEWLPEWARG